MTVSELRFGVASSARKRENVAALEDFLSRFELLDYPVQAGSEYARVRKDLAQAGSLIGGNDLFIAAHALCIPARLATANVGEFRRVKGLQVLDWLA